MAGPLIDSRSTLELPSKHSRVVPEVLFSSVAIVEHEITFPMPTLFGVVVPHDVRRSIEASNAEMIFIENPHLFLLVPWL
jgi:hypothetical protein